MTTMSNDPKNFNQFGPSPSGDSSGKNNETPDLSKVTGPSIDRNAERKANGPQPEPSKMAAEVNSPSLSSPQKNQPEPSKMASESAAPTNSQTTSAPQQTQEQKSR